MMTPEERHELVLELTQALACAQPKPQLTEEELQWIKLAIAAEARKIKFRDAVIEKTITGLVWAAIVGLGYIMLDWAKAHGFNP